MAEEVVFDIESLTIGEALAAEDASGQDITKLLASTSRRVMLAVFVQRLRNSGQPPSWQELGSLRLLDTHSGRSQPSRGSRSETSSD